MRLRDCSSRGFVRVLLFLTFALLFTNTLHAQQVQLQGPLAGSHGMRENIWAVQTRGNSHIALSATLGILSRATTGTLVGYGYDAAVSPSVGVNARISFGHYDCYSCSAGHGFDLGYTLANGPTLGAFHSAAFQTHLFDLAYVFRMEFPCMRRPGRSVWFSAMGGLTAMVANAGLGDTTYDDDQLLNERILASQQYDHGALGWRLGAAMDWDFGNFLVGFELNLRDLYGVGTNQVRSFLLGAALRIGGDWRF